MQQSFYQVLNQFQTHSQYDKFIKETTKEYDIKTYRLQLISLDNASLIYKQLHQRYQQNLLQRMPCGWHENERRLYIWFIVCYIHLKSLEPVKLLDNEKHWKHISHLFWDKDIFLLKYQLHTVIKTRGRTIWKKAEDDLLKEVYEKHEKGEWNEIAKDFYFRSNGEWFKTPKQCRERWQNHLDTHINKADWTKQQERILFQEVKSYGTKWARIIPLLKNARTQHMIKNKYKALLNKEIQGKNITEGEAINAILRRINEECFLKERKSMKEVRKSIKVDVEQKKHTEDAQIQNSIQFVQSVQIFESAQQNKKKRGRPKKKDKNQSQKGKQKVSAQYSFQKSNNLKKIGQIQGCIFMGSDMPYLQQYLMASQRSDSLYGGESNSFLRSSAHHQMFNSHYSINSMQLPCDDKSLVPLDQFTVKQDRSAKFQKSNSFQSFNSYNSIRIRPNESNISKFINSRAE